MNKRSKSFLKLLTASLFVAVLSIALVTSADPKPDSSKQIAARLVAPFDLVSDAFDPNGIPLNPQWGWRRTHPEPDRSLPDPNQLCNGFPATYVPFTSPPRISGYSAGSPPCTNQPISFDTATGWNGFLCTFKGTSGKLHGHVNWNAATYEGPIYWDSHSSPGTDDDYNFRLAPPSLTTLVPSAALLGIEFDSDETIDHFHTPWWEWFHRAVDDGSGDVITGSEAIVIGLLGLDCEHSCATEIHPVWAMAIHDVNKRSPSDDVWAIFVRNWGNEGYCSSKNHLLDLTSITFKLPWKPNASSVNVGSSTRFLFGPDDLDDNAKRQVSGPWVDYVPNEGVYVRFTLPRPEAGARINGELHLQWSGPRLSDPCIPLKTRLDALLADLNRLSSIPARKAEIEGVRKAAERRIEQWHRTHDQEVEELRRKIAQCQNTASAPTVALTRLTAQPKKEGEAESGLKVLYEKMTPAQRQVFQAKLGRRVSYDQFVTPQTTMARQLSRSLLPVTSPPPTPVRAIPYPRKEEKDRLRIEALCTAFNGNIPGFPNACK